MGSRTDRTTWGTSPLGGVPVTLPPPGAPVGTQLGLAAIDPTPTRRALLPGVVHIRSWLTLDEQRALADDFREWARPPAGLRHPRVPAGHVMSIQSVCLGWHWSPYAYSRTADDTDGAPVKPMPPHVVELSQRAIRDAYGDPGDFDPDAAIVNLYPPGAQLGLHQDGEEPAAQPVVTIALGDTGVFRLAGVDRRTGPFTDVELTSGDLLVFGGPNRLIFHGVPKVFPGTSPPELGLPPGRLSITVRQTGL